MCGCVRAIVVTKDPTYRFAQALFLVLKFISPLFLYISLYTEI
jgi:hypothetical protein